MYSDKLRDLFRRGSFGTDVMERFSECQGWYEKWLAENGASDDARRDALDRLLHEAVTSERTGAMGIKNVVAPLIIIAFDDVSLAVRFYAVGMMASLFENVFKREADGGELWKLGAALEQAIVYLAMRDPEPIIRTEALKGIFERRTVKALLDAEKDETVRAAAQKRYRWLAFKLMRETFEEDKIESYFKDDDDPVIREAVRQRLFALGLEERRKEQIVKALDGEAPAVSELDTPLGKLCVMSGWSEDSLSEHEFVVEYLPCSIQNGDDCLFRVDRRVRITPTRLDEMSMGPFGILLRCQLMRPLDDLGSMSGGEIGECYEAMSLYEGNTKLTIGCVNQADDFEDFDYDNPYGDADYDSEGMLVPVFNHDEGSGRIPALFSRSLQGECAGVELGITDALHTTNIRDACFIVSWLTSDSIDADDAQICIEGGKDHYTYFASDPFYLKSGR